MSGGKKQRMPWVKLWESWYTTPSHLELDTLSLHVGPRLLTLASASPVRGELRGSSGRPLTHAQLATACRLTAAQVRSVLDQLEACGTLSAEGGCYTFPEFEEYQETPEAKRQRKSRANRKERDLGVTSSVTSSVTVTPDVTTRGKRIEVKKIPAEEAREVGRAQCLVEAARVCWEREGLPEPWLPVDGVAAVRFYDAVAALDPHDNVALEALVGDLVLACATQRYPRGETSNRSAPVGFGWLVAPTEAVRGGPARPLPHDKHVTRLRRLLEGEFYDRDHAAEAASSKPRTQAQQGFDEVERLRAEEEARAKGPPSGALRLAAGSHERRARWVRGGEA